MAKIITITNDRDGVMIVERRRIIPFARGHGWTYVGYNNDGDHVMQIGRAGAGRPLEVLDLDCHGSPTTFDHTDLPFAGAFGQALSKLNGFSPNTPVYLDACNTGLTSFRGGPIAQEVANGAGCTVYGTKGFMYGTYAENTERCLASVNGFSYPGAQDATGRDVWIAFHPQARSTPGTEEVLFMAWESTINVHAGDGRDLYREIASLMEIILATGPISFPALRMAPDVTVNYIRNEGAQILDVFANGALIQDRVMETFWRVPAAIVEQFRNALLAALE